MYNSFYSAILLASQTAKLIAGFLLEMVVYQMML